MASFYNNACRVDAKMALFQPELQVSVIDDGLTYYVPKNSDEKLELPHSIMNENVAINYRTIYNGYPTFFDLHDQKQNFTEYDDYKKCRLGFETGDVLKCKYEVPCDFCPKTTPILYTLCEVIRCGGNFKLRGAEKPYETEFKCPDGFVEFKLGSREIEKGSKNLIKAKKIIDKNKKHSASPSVFYNVKLLASFSVASLI